ncbi:hypothetical protein EBB07_30470 [Paenibacillaceae bacterium]|nr:hypothetical protein EBB07_30470 [Paenibacillaceae bacterium]
MKIKLVAEHIYNQEFSIERALNWILNSMTSEFCMRFFHEWLEIAESGTQQLTTPSWKEIIELKEKSFSKFNFRFETNSKDKQF